MWQYYRDEPALNQNTSDFPGNSDSFKLKEKITGQKGNDGTKDVEIMVPLKYVSNFCKDLEIPLINCEINLILTWSANSFIVLGTANNQVTLFAITDTFEININQKQQCRHKTNT